LSDKLEKRIEISEGHWIKAFGDLSNQTEKRIELSEAHWDKSFGDLGKRFDDQVVLLRDIQSSVQGLQLKAATWGGGAAVIVALGSLVLQHFLKG
jgi:hypothetical protein